jgi:hypothetical protein
MVELSGLPSSVLHLGGKYLRAQRITYATDTGAWQFDPAPESVTEFDFCANLCYTIWQMELHIITICGIKSIFITIKA